MIKNLLRRAKGLLTGILLCLSLGALAQPTMPTEERIHYSHADTLPSIIPLDQHCWYDSVTLTIDANFQYLPDGMELTYPDGEIIFYKDSLGGNGFIGYIEFHNDLALYPPVPSDHEWWNNITVQIFRFVITIDQTEYVIIKFISGGAGTGAWMYLHPPMYYGGNTTLVVHDTVYVDHINDIGYGTIVEGSPPCHTITHTKYILDPEVGDVNVYIPNIFTPNYDGNNDTFKPYFKDRQLRDVRIEIYNRWGGLLFSGPEWNGTANNNQRCAEGTYAFIIRGTLPSGEEFMEYGDITLIR